MLKGLPESCRSLLAIIIYLSTILFGCIFFSLSVYTYNNKLLSRIKAACFKLAMLSFDLSPNKQHSGGHMHILDLVIFQC